jgi:hypothetical protein
MNLTSRRGKKKKSQETSTSKNLFQEINLLEHSTKSRFNQGCQFCFGRCFVFSIGMECFSFGVF